MVEHYGEDADTVSDALKGGARVDLEVDQELEGVVSNAFATEPATRQGVESAA